MRAYKNKMHQINGEINGTQHPRMNAAEKVMMAFVDGMLIESALAKSCQENHISSCMSSIDF